MKISKGLATWAGLVAAIGQYALAIALFMDTFNETDPTAGLGPLATATATLYAVIKGRMDQAKAAIETPAPKPPAAYTVGAFGGTTGTNVTSTFTQPRAGAETRTTASSEDEPGDRDALPDYETAERPPADVGDEHARPEAGQ